ncbi:MAG: hypothetical protein M3O62_05350 [Pseudomonadota bacterium]|nr:hypothetical protein [Pseudomonadota bacterium]
MGALAYRRYRLTRTLWMSPCNHFWESIMQIAKPLSEPVANGQVSGIKADGSVSGVAREFHNFVADIEDLVKSTTSLTSEDLANVKARLSARIATAKLSIEEAGGAIADKARNTVKITDDYAHDRPWQAIGIGAAVGFLAGVVLARRK